MTTQVQNHQTHIPLTGRRKTAGQTYEEDRDVWIEARIDRTLRGGAKRVERVRLTKAYDKLVGGWNFRLHTAKYKTH